MTQERDPIEDLQRRVKKLERALEVVINETETRIVVDQAEEAWRAGQQAKGDEAREKLSDLTRRNR